MPKKKLKFDHSKSLLADVLGLDITEAEEIAAQLRTLVRNKQKETEILEGIYEKYTSAAEIIFAIYSFGRMSAMHIITNKFLSSLTG